MRFLNSIHAGARRYRRMSPTESLYLALSRNFPPCAIQLRIEGEALPSAVALEQAAALAAQANAGARLAPDGAWWIDTGIPPRVRRMPRDDTPTLSHPLFHEPFPFGGQPPLEIVHWEGAGVIFRCSHALMDAGGLLFFAEETFRALRGEPLLGTSTPVSDFDYLLSLRHRPRPAWERAGMASPLGRPISDRAGFVRDRRFIAGQVSAVGARAAASLSQMAQRNSPGAPARWMFPADLRYKDASMRTTANFTNPIILETAAACDWAELYRRTLEAMARHDERRTSCVYRIVPRVPDPVLAHAARWAHERQVRAGRYLFSGIVSHIGNVSLRALSTRTFTPRLAFLLPFDAPGAALTLITVQHENGLEIAASCPAATGANGRLEAALDELCAELQPGRGAAAGAAPARIGYQPMEGPGADLPHEANVYELFAEQARAFPQCAAVTEAGHSLSYAELERLSLSCAAHLCRRGVKSGDKVAILSDRTSDTIIGLLGILSMGAVFVPLDTAWPQERIRFVLNDCQAACLLVQDEHAERAEWSHVRFSELTAPETGPPQPGLMRAPASAAYVLYTSGSTGMPKGVVVGHRSLVNYLLWARAAYGQGLDTPLVFPFFTSLAFDLTLTSLFLPLTSGGEVRILPHKDPLDAIRSILADPAINAVKLTPSHLWLLWGCGVGKSGLRKYIVGGEALPARLAEEIHLQSSSRAEIFNEYGPTEATIGCVVHRFDPRRDRQPSVKIGRPIANTEVLLLDSHLRPVADGDLGEIFLAGDCLALGYLNRAAEEARFMPHPFRAEARVYRTGDLAVRTPGGVLDYRGRTDVQVKVRGHRIEPGEIEAAIAASGLCGACAVVAEYTPGGTRLAAFVTWSGEGRNEALRAALRKTLPAYMIPSRMVGLDQIPLSTNGKVDKSRLPRDAEAHGQSAIPSAGMADGIEEALAAMVVSLPGMTAVSVPHDKSLLELGLDSLQMMLLLTMAETRFVPAADHDLFFAELGEFVSAPSVQNLARHLRRFVADAASPGSYGLEV